MFDVTALGEILIDFAMKEADSEGYPLMKANPGGAPGNFLAALNAYGCSTALISKVGDDTFGKLLVNTITNLGVDTSGVIVTPDVFTTLAFVTIDETGNREFSFARKPGADASLSYEEVNLSLIDAARDFHFGSLSMTAEPARTTTMKAVEYAKAKGKIISFDPNLRKPLWANLKDAAHYMKWGLERADIIKISDEEVEFLWGKELSIEDAAAKLLNEYGATIVFITLGPKGCYCANHQGGVYVASPKVQPVDTTGAGDIFGGSALSQLLQLNIDIKQITLEQIATATKFACTAASLSTENYGGISGVVPKDIVLSKL